MMATAPRAHGIAVPSRGGMELGAHGTGQGLQQGRGEEENTHCCLCAIRRFYFCAFETGLVPMTDPGTK